MPEHWRCPTCNCIQLLNDNGDLQYASDVFFERAEKRIRTLESDIAESPLTTFGDAALLGSYKIMVALMNDMCKEDLDRIEKDLESLSEREATFPDRPIVPVKDAEFDEGEARDIEIKELKEDLSMARAEITQIKKERIELIEQADCLQDSLGKCREECNNLDHRAAGIKKERVVHRKIKKERDTLRSEKEELMSKLNATQNMLDDADTRHKALEEDYVKLHETLTKDFPEPDIEDMNASGMRHYLRNTTDPKTIGRILHTIYQEAIYANAFDYETFEDFVKAEVKISPEQAIMEMVRFNDSVVD